jgi:hypothetical protein
MICTPTDPLPSPLLHWKRLSKSAERSSTRLPFQLAARAPRNVRADLVCRVFPTAVEAANQRHQGEREFLVTRRYTPLIELLIGDCANRLSASPGSSVRRPILAFTGSSRRAR